MGDSQASTQCISFSLLCQVIRNKETEKQVLNRLCSDQRRFKIDESTLYFIGLLCPTNNLTMSKSVPLDLRPSSITRVPWLRMHCAGYWIGSSGQCYYT